MQFSSFLRQLHLAYFSKPSADRTLYRAIRRLQVRSIIEIGLGQGVRSTRLIETALSSSPNLPVSFVGLDPFEARSPHSPGMTLKRAYQNLRPLGASIRLIPGESSASLAAHANALAGTDMLVISMGQNDASFEQAWFYVPRMLHENSLVFVEKSNSKGGCYYHLLDKESIAELAHNAVTEYRRAA